MESESIAEGDPTMADVEGGEVDAVDGANDGTEPVEGSELVGPHTFPNNNRRRIPAAIYIVAGLAMFALYAARGNDSPLVNIGLLWAGVGLVVFGVYGMVAGWTLKVEESDALISAARYLGFPVGHSAAQLVWRGWFSRPTWRILTYSTEDPPQRRAMVIVDGITGEVIEGFAEPNPEDWSSVDAADKSLSGPTPTRP